MDHLGQRMYTVRKSLGLSLEAVGNYVGVGKSTVRKWENGMIKNMRRDKIKLLSEVLHVSPGYLMGWTDDPLDFNDKTSYTKEADLTDSEMQVLSILRKMSADQQQAVLDFLNRFSPD